MLHTRIVALVGIALLAVAEPAPLLSQESDDEAKAPVAFRSTKKSSVRFASPNSNFPRAAVLFHMKKTDAEKFREEHFISHDHLPNCERAEILLEEVYDYTKNSEHLDILYYNPDDSSQIQRARSYTGYIAPYIAFLYADPELGEPNFIQNFARIVGVKCLPTRFRFVEIGQKRYAEFRTGAKAWSNE